MYFHLGILIKLLQYNLKYGYLPFKLSLDIALIHTFLTTYIHAKAWMINSENGEFKAIAIHLACYRNTLQSTECSKHILI
jgi:hypothetical protein